MEYTIYIQEWVDGPNEFEPSPRVYDSVDGFEAAKKTLREAVEGDTMSAYWAQDEDGRIFTYRLADDVLVPSYSRVA